MNHFIGLFCFRILLPGGRESFLEFFIVNFSAYIVPGPCFFEVESFLELLIETHRSSKKLRIGIGILPLNCSLYPSHVPVFQGGNADSLFKEREKIFIGAEVQFVSNLFDGIIGFRQQLLGFSQF